MQNVFGVLQKLGKSLMLPVSVLPVAGILLGVGSAHFGIIPTGKQRRIDEFNGVTVVPATVCTTTRSLSNRSNSVQAREFRVYLIEKEQKTTLLIRKFRVAGEAFAFSRQLSSMLQIPLIPEINRYNLNKPSLDAGPKQKSP